MAISGQLNINIGLPNESANSDSLYTAFNKIETNFTNLFDNASPYSTIAAGNGIAVSLDTGNGTATINNDGVINIIASNSISVSDDGNGNVTLSVIGDGNGNIVAGVTSVGVFPASNARLTVTGTNPVTSAGNLLIDLATSGVVSGTYTYPTVTVDSYGRVTSIANASSVGTVTSVGLTPGSGIQITGGPVTTNGNITVTNTGVTRLTAGSGIVLSGSNGNVTISSPTSGGTVTSVGISSASLTVSGSPIVTSGVITIELPNDIIVSNLDVTNTARFGSPVNCFIFSNGGITTTSYVSAGSGLAIMYANGLITGTDIASSGTLYSYGNTIIAGNLTVGDKARFEGGVFLANDGTGATINWEDDQSPGTDTSIAYNNSADSLVITVNNTSAVEIYSDKVTIQEPLNLTSGLNLYTTTSMNFIDSNGANTDTSIYYTNSGPEALVVALNNSSKMQIENGQTVMFGNTVVHTGNLEFANVPAILKIANANATTIHFAGAATAMAIGATGSAMTFRGNISVDKSLTFTDANGTVGDTSVYYTNSGPEALVVALNNSSKVQIENGQTILYGNVTTNGNLTVTSNITTERIYGNPDALDIYSLSGFTHVARAEAAQFKTFVDFNVNSLASIDSGNALIYTSGNLIIDDEMFCNGLAIFNNDVTAVNLGLTGNLFATGNSQINGNSSVVGNTVAQKNLTVWGNVNYTGTDDLQNGGAANLQTYTTYFQTSGVETATLAAGSNGQVKVFIMTNSAGAMTITVTNAGWGGAGTMTFNTTGQACTLQYISSKWWCIGNNGVTFA